MEKITHPLYGLFSYTDPDEKLWNEALISCGFPVSYRDVYKKALRLMQLHNRLVNQRVNDYEQYMHSKFLKLWNERIILTI